MKFKFLRKDKTANLPKSPGVYAFKKGAEFLYIGKAADIRERVNNHFQQPTYRDNLFINQASKIGFIKTNSEIESLILEAKLIKKYQPKYNVLWRDDKNYFFVGVTKEDFPRIFWTHQVSKFEIRPQPISNELGRPALVHGRWRNSKFEIVGPFVDGTALKQTLKLLRKVFPYRSCRVMPNRPCLWYHLNRCPAPCLLKSKAMREIPADYLKIKKISQKNAKNLMKIFREGKKQVLKDLKKEMKLASENQDFETAAKIRDQIMALERILEHAKIFETRESPALINPEQINDSWQRIEEELKRILKTRKKISRIEAYDVSNIQGQKATGSMVTFINGLPDKNFYRKFKIKIEGRPNDVAMIKEVLSRRLNHPEWGWPDLILIDGGKAQLNAALSLTKIPVIALAKKKNELFVKNLEKPILLEKLNREVFNLILQLRDEAHRFARKYHHRLREIDFFSKS